MKTLFLVASLLLVSFGIGNAQNSFGNALWVKKVSSQFFPQLNGVAPSGPDYGCMSIKSRPLWLLVSTCGSSSHSFGVEINSNTYGNLATIDSLSFAMWGPFNDTTNAFSQLTSTNLLLCGNSFAANPSYNDGANLTANKIYYVLITGSDSIQWVGFVISSMQPDEYTDSLHCTVCSGMSNYVGQDVCIVTNDSITNKNEIMWNAESSSMMSYIIYRETSNFGQYDSIGIVAAGNNFFVDQSGDPQQQSYTYKVGTIDSCNNVHDIATNGQSTIHLTSNTGINGEVNLSWNAYGGYPAPGYSSYSIFRNTDGGPYSLITTVSSSVTSFTDLIPPAGVLQYRVGIEMPSCFQGIQPYAYSNKSMVGNVGLSEVTSSSEVQLFPNPAHSTTELNFGTLAGTIKSVKIISIVGDCQFKAEVVNQPRLQLDLGNIAGGAYVVEVTGDNFLFRIPLMIE